MTFQQAELRLEPESVRPQRHVCNHPAGQRRASADVLVKGKSLGRGGLHGESGPLAAPLVRPADLEVPMEGFGAGGICFYKPTPQNPTLASLWPSQMEAVSFLTPCVL